MFGAAKPATTGFGGFGQTATPTPSFGFGTNTGTGLLGAQQPTTGFGAAQPSGSLQFGAPQPATGLSFGAPQTSTTGFQFGSAAAQPTTSLSFGAPITSTTATPSLFGSANFGLGSSAAPTPTSTLSTGFSLGQAKTTGGLSLGTATSSFSFGSTTSAAPTLNFGSGLATTSSAGFSLGGGGLFGSATTGTGLTTATSTTTVGLGGVDTSQSKLGLSGTGIAEPKHVKDNPLPDPILQTFNEFQAFVKQQKSLSVDIAHSSSKPVKRVQEEIEALEAKLANITNGLARSSVATEKLKQETAQSLFHADMAQRIRENPSGLGYENGPEQYFLELVNGFETDAARLQVQVEAAERHLRSITQSSALSPQELTTAMKRLHETLVVLAARVQSLHVAVQGSQQDYRHLRHVYLKEDLPALPKSTVASRKPTQRSLAGPTPFSETAGVASLSADALSMLTGGTVLQPSATSPGWCLSQTPGTAIMASPPSSFLSTLPVENTGFQLARPPIGNKRNKR